MSFAFRLFSTITNSFRESAEERDCRASTLLKCVSFERRFGHIICHIISKWHFLNASRLPVSCLSKASLCFSEVLLIAFHAIFPARDISHDYLCFLMRTRFSDGRQAFQNAWCCHNITSFFRDEIYSRGALPPRFFKVYFKAFCHACHVTALALAASARFGRIVAVMARLTRFSYCFWWFRLTHAALAPSPPPSKALISSLPPAASHASEDELIFINLQLVFAGTQQRRYWFWYSRPIYELADDTGTMSLTDYQVYNYSMLNTPHDLSSEGRYTPWGDICRRTAYDILHVHYDEALPALMTLQSCLPHLFTWLPCLSVCTYLWGFGLQALLPD